MHRVLVATTRALFGPPRVQPLALRLVEALETRGHAADVVMLPFCGTGGQASNGERMATRLFDWRGLPEVHGDRLIALDLPTCAMGHDHIVLWFAGTSGSPRSVPVGSLEPSTESHRLPPPGRRFAVSSAASWVLEQQTGLFATPLAPPVPDPERYHWQPSGDHLLLPAAELGRARRSLILQALARTRAPVRLQVAGPRGLADGWSHELFEEAETLGVVDRVAVFDGVGGLPDAVARARCVICPEFLESLPWMAVRSGLASKAVLTCSDSGALAEAVVHGETGAVVEPRPRALARVMDELWRDEALSDALGRGGRAKWADCDFDWGPVVDALFDA